MLKSFEHICPKVCEGRSAHCHETCPQHQKFREEKEAERDLRNRAVIHDSLTRNVFRYERKWTH